MESSRWTAGLLLIVTFALGLCIGFIVHSQLFTSGDGRRPQGGPGRPNIGREGLIQPPGIGRALIEELDLTPEQREEFDRIFEDHRRQTMVLRRDIIQPQQQTLTDSLRARTERLLSPGQMRRFRAFRQSYRQGQFRGPPRGRPGGPPDRFGE